jgi:hypothetical protein
MSYLLMSKKVLYQQLKGVVDGNKINNYTFNQ